MLVVPDSVLTKTLRSPHSFCSHHFPSGLMSPNMTVSAAGSYQLLVDVMTSQKHCLINTTTTHQFVVLTLQDCLEHRGYVLSHSVISYSLQSHGLQPTRLLCPWDSPDKNTGVCCHALLQRTFPTQRLNLHLPHCRWIPYRLSHQGSPQCCQFPSAKQVNFRICEVKSGESVLGWKSAHGTEHTLQVGFIDLSLRRTEYNSEQSVFVICKHEEQHSFLWKSLFCCICTILWHP